MTTPLVFLDTETDGVHPGRKPWEIGMIRVDEAGTTETTFFVEVDLATADPFALRLGRFYDRHPAGRILSGLDQITHDTPTTWRAPVRNRPEVLDTSEAALRVARWTHGAHIVGAVTNFDTETLTPLLRGAGLTPAWDHRLVCVESLTAGHLGRLVGGLASCATALGIEFDPDTEHTALGDATTAKRIYDQIMAAKA